MHCWGNDEFGQTNVPATQVNAATLISASWDYTCGVNINSKLDCWGFNYLGQANPPKNLHGGRYTILSVHTGMTHACARYYMFKRDIGNDSTMLNCWGGHNEYGQKNIPKK